MVREIFLQLTKIYTRMSIHGILHRHAFTTRDEALLLLGTPELHDPTQFPTKYACLFSRKHTSGSIYS
ncbi:uncharacterized protein V1513DRAFT_453535, partial [Lipomyces chichibuensis]|uniref:uncharacterized protein n=1 Tax=Lipomyces chichibuensis TaxID=1546026 RepID=UPI003343DE23